MASRRPGDDPYRTLGILRGAELDQIKAAHRRLAKRYHPDGSMGDEQRFLAVQEAYQLLSDPLRRRQWDRRHASAPVSASEPSGRRESRPSAWAARSGSGRASAAGSAAGRDGAARPSRPQPAPGQRTTTWSAEHVPWWQDFRPRGQSGEDTAAARKPAAAGGEPTTHPRPSTAGQAGDDAAARPVMEFDVFSRSSGAAWSMAARRHFRRGDEELPSRGAWRYRGTQVVTGAEARKVAAEEAAEAMAREGDTGHGDTRHGDTRHGDTRSADTRPGDTPPGHPGQEATRDGKADQGTTRPGNSRSRPPAEGPPR
jgi:curved DNA-binding protein CbpA